MSAINELRVPTKEKAKVEEKLQQVLFDLNQALTVEPPDAKQVRVGRLFGSSPFRLLEVAAHDLRNPVSSVLAATQYLIEDAGRRLETYHVTLLRSIESSAALMLQLLRDMLEIADSQSKTNIARLAYHGYRGARGTCRGGEPSPGGQYQCQY